MFKRGDIVYCIDTKCEYVSSTEELIDFELKLDTPYTLRGVLKSHIALDESINHMYVLDKFISEKNYQISKRKNKILKLKKCLK